MNYVRCIKNSGFIYNQNGQLFDETISDLIVGQVYKVAPPAPNDDEMLRVIDESGEDYLYPASYFEPLAPRNVKHRPRMIAIYVDDFTKDILYAEAVAAKKSVSTLVREWVDDRLDLPAVV
jgi:hypothetical protein